MEQMLIPNTTMSNLTWLPALLYLMHILLQRTFGLIFDHSLTSHNFIKYALRCHES